MLSAFVIGSIALVFFGALYVWLRLTEPNS